MKSRGNINQAVLMTPSNMMSQVRVRVFQAPQVWCDEIWPDDAFWHRCGDWNITQIGLMGVLKSVTLKEPHFSTSLDISY